MSRNDKPQIIYDYNSQTLEHWKDTLQTLELNAEFDEKHKLIVPSLIEYVLGTLNLMVQVKGQYSEDSFIIALIKHAELQHKRVKTFINAFVKSFEISLFGNQELCYFTYMLSPENLIITTSEQFAFYLKLRKYIYSNFINERDAKVKPLGFDQWVSVVSKHMDNSAISEIGNKIRENAGERVRDKILKNSVKPIDLLIYCYELQGQRLNPQQQQQQQQRNIQTFSPIQQQLEQDIHSTPKKSQQLQQSQQQQYQSEQNYIKKQELEQQEELKTKMKEVIVIHEHLAQSYNKLVQFTSQSQSALQEIFQQISDGQQLNQQQIQELQKIIKFKDFLQNDPEITLRDCGIYDLL